MLDQLGAGLGLRIAHIQHVLKEKPAIPWFEVHICNFLRGGLNRQLLRKVAEHYPLSFHGVSLNLGGTDTLNSDYLSRLKKAVDEYQPVMVSEHACFTAMGTESFNDLLPVPFTTQAVKHFSRRIEEVQAILGRRILLENVSRYTHYEESDMSEAQFLSAISDRSGCGILLDLNNAYVNQCNLGESLETFVDDLPFEKIDEIHLAGHTNQDGLLVDTHSEYVCDAVWSAFDQLNQRHPDIPALIEWDSQLPAFTELEKEQQKAQAIINTYTQNGQQGVL